MNNKTVAAAIMAMIMSTGGSAFAQGKSDRDDHKGNRDDRGHQNQSQRNGHQDWRDNPGHAKQVQRRDERGAGPSHSYHRGDRLPAENRHRQYVVNDWRSHRLSAPPRGYHWVQTGGDYVLVAIATGIILQLFLN